MKVFSLIMLIFTLFACTTEDHVYSCDPEVNEFIKGNLSEIQSLSRSEFNKISKNIQPAMFAAMPTGKKQMMWEEKTNEVLKLDWTNKERQHIELLLQEIKSNYKWYEDPILYEDEIDTFAYKWLSYANDELQWDQSTVYHIGFCLNPIIKNEGKTMFLEEENNEIETNNFIIKTRVEYPDVPATVKCTCRESEGDYYTSCGATKLMECKKWNCIAVFGCGLAFQQVCDGGCFRNDLG